MKCPKCGSENIVCSGKKRYEQDEYCFCKDCNLDILRLDKVLAKFNLGWHGYTDLYIKIQDGFIQYENKKFNIGYDLKSTFTPLIKDIPLDAVESLFKDMEANNE